MTLSRNERAALRRLGDDLGRRDPRLAWQLVAFTTLEEPAATWRPPRVAVALAAVMVAGVVFLVAAMTALMRAPCSVAPHGRDTTATRAAAAGTAAAGGAAVPSGPTHHARPSPSAPRPTSPSAVPC